MQDTELSDVMVIGAGVAGTSFLRGLRELGHKAKITLIDKNDYYFPKEEIAKNPVNTGELKKIEVLAKELGVDFIQAEVEKVSERNKKVSLDDSKSLTFKSLVVATGALSNKLEIKGVRKEGVFYLPEVTPAKVKALLKISSEISILVHTNEGIKFSFFLNSLGKEIRVIAPDLKFLGEEKEKTINLFTEKGIKIHLGYSLDEIIGEKEVKAVKITATQECRREEASSLPMKVFSSRLVFIDNLLKPNIEFFNDSENILEKKESLAADKNIYIIGDAANMRLKEQKSYEGNRLEAEKAGRFLAESQMKT